MPPPCVTRVFDGVQLSPASRVAVATGVARVVPAQTAMALPPPSMQGVLRKAQAVSLFTRGREKRQESSRVFVEKDVAFMKPQ